MATVAYPWLSPWVLQRLHSSAFVQPEDSAGLATPLVCSLRSLDDLERLGHSRSVILVAQGHAAGVAAAAAADFSAAAAILEARFPGQLSFYVIDNASHTTAAKALLTRLGLEHDAPFAVILDRFIETEEKYLMRQRTAPSSAEITTFVSDFIAGSLTPAMLGQPRPPLDRSESWPQLWEVVTDSFNDVVLDPTADVFLEALSPRCNACMAYAPRMRMLSFLAAVHAPRLRVATMDILSNDKPRACIPEVGGGRLNGLGGGIASGHGRPSGDTVPPHRLPVCASDILPLPVAVLVTVSTRLQCATRDGPAASLPVPVAGCHWQV